MTGNDDKTPPAGKDDKAKKDGKDGSDQASGFTKSFDQYEYIAVITPGAVLLFGLYFVFHPNIPFAQLKDIGFGSFGVFLVGAYVAGHIIRAIGDVLERLFWCLFGGMPSEWVLYERPEKRGLLSKQQQDKLVAEIKEPNFDFTTLQVKSADGCSDRRAKFEQWQAVTRKISIKVHDAKKAVRVDVFNRTYGMMVGITAALLILFGVLLVQSYIAGFGWTQSTIGAVIAVVLAAFSMYRMFIFGKLYARELYVSFLELK